MSSSQDLSQSTSDGRGPLPAPPHRGLRLIVCGGRDFQSYWLLERVLNEIHAERGIDFVFHGNARGADMCAAIWADKQPGVREVSVPAQWAKYGKRAGPIRNQHMLGQSPDLVVAFPGGAGTADMVRRAEAAGVPVWKIKHPSGDGVGRAPRPPVTGDAVPGIPSPSPLSGD